MIITNDGDFTNALIHPSSGISKEYIVKVDKILNDKQIEKFKSGLDIGNGEMTSDAAIRYIKNNTYIVTIRQGYNRQIRRMFAVLGSTVIGLKRTRIGAIHLNDLIAGKYKKFDKKEMEFVSLMKE